MKNVYLGAWKSFFKITSHKTGKQKSQGWRKPSNFVCNKSVTHHEKFSKVFAVRAQ